MVFDEEHDGLILDQLFFVDHCLRAFVHLYPFCVEDTKLPSLRCLEPWLALCFANVAVLYIYGFWSRKICSNSDQIVVMCNMLSNQDSQVKHIIIGTPKLN